MVGWNVETLLLGLYTIAVICAVYIAVRAFQQKPLWGAVFLLGPVAFWYLAGFTGFLVAGLMIAATQIWYVKQPHNWSSWGRIYVYMVLCWAGATTVHARNAGWQFFPFLDAAPDVEVQQAGTDRPSVVEDFLPVEGGRIWYRQVGDAAATPVILVHGGPGAGSYALKPFDALADERAVVRYDQLGAGRSDRATDTTLFAIPRFVAELDSLRAALGHDRVHLLGHGWGAALAIEYHRAHPDRVASLTLAGPLVNARQWAASTRALVKTLSEDAQRWIGESEQSGDFDSPDFATALAEFSDRYVSRQPDGASRDSARRQFGDAQYRHMWGPSEFTVVGSLRNYDARRHLRSVAVPTLFVAGQHDVADTAAVRGYAAMTPGAEFMIVPGAAHVHTWDRPIETVQAVRDFLRRADQGAHN